MTNKQLVKCYSIAGGLGTQLFVEETGNPNGRTLLFIHGFSQNREVWNKQFQSHLANEFRMVRFDIRGHGLSEKPRDGYSDSKIWADDIHLIVETLDLDGAVLIGWSYGGIIIFDYLRHYGEQRISGINLVGARSRIGVAESIAETGTVYPTLKPHLFSNDVEESVGALEKFIKLCTYQELPADELYFYLGFNAVVPPYVRQGLMNRSVTNDDLLPNLSKPFLITHGIEDPIVLLCHAQYNAICLKNVETSFYEKVAHNPFWENTDRFNKELRRFVESLE